MTENQSIKETLKIIRKALEEEKEPIDESEKILLLNKLVEKDGTINSIESDFIEKEEIKKILRKNISDYFDKNFDKWLNKNVPTYLDKYFKDK